MQLRLSFVLSVLVFLLPSAAAAEMRATPSLMGSLGLNNIPSARMDPEGTARVTVSALDPYVHAQLGYQVAGPLYIGLRQTGQENGQHIRPRAFFPGADIKLGLLREGTWAPEIAIGLQSALGDRRMAGEYLALSKRWGNFDFTGGLGWGRLGSDGHIPNPLGMFGGHFDKKRRTDGVAQNPGDWFTGENIGAFAGIEYFPPQFPNISLKADWGSDGYKAEEALFNHHASQPWSVGFSYRPEPWVSLGAAYVGNDRVMGTLSMSGLLDGWPHRYRAAEEPPPLDDGRAGDAQPAEAERVASVYGIGLYNTRASDSAVWTTLDIDANSSLPQQIGRAARPVAGNAGASAEEIAIVPVRNGLEGPVVTLNRRDLEGAIVRKEGSPAEIWRDATIGMQDKPIGYRAGAGRRHLDFHLTLDNTISLADRNSGLLYRTALVGDALLQVAPHVVTGGALRLNIHDNLSGIMPLSEHPVRGDVERFAGIRAGIDRLYAGWLSTPMPDLHFAATAGLLEEMYGGAGTELLWRPAGKTYAVGADAWWAIKRDPGSLEALGYGGRQALTMHLNGWYEIPNSPLTLQAQVGRYLAGDFGGSLALERVSDNGVKLRGVVTATTKSDTDLFGGDSSVYTGMELKLPFGDRRWLPRGTAIRLAAQPLGRDAGQTIDKPLPLYDMTREFSQRQIARHWNEIAE